MNVAGGGVGLADHAEHASGETGAPTPVAMQDRKPGRMVKRARPPAQPGA